MADRRRNNEGSIYQVEGGGWEAAVTMARGKRRRLRRATYAEALAARDLLIRERDEQAQVDRRLTVAQLLDQWLARVRRSKTRPRTWEAYEAEIRLRIKPELGDRRAANVTPGDIRRLYDSITETHSVASLVKTRAVLMGAFGWAAAEERLPRNVVALVKIEEAQPYEPKRLSAAEAIEVLEAIREHEHGPFWAFLLATGCRFGEASGLRWADVDLDAATVFLERAASRVPKAYREDGRAGWEIARMKTSRSRRALPLTQFAVAALTRQAELVEQLQSSPDPRWTWQDNDLVFPSRAGTPLRNDHVGRRWDQLLKDHKLPDIRLHDLRHTLGTLQRRAGADLQTIRDLLGHASIQMTADTYVGEVPEALRAAVSRLDKMLAPKPVATDVATKRGQQAS